MPPSEHAPPTPPATAALRAEPELAPRYRKDREDELFLQRINDALAPHELASYRELPETWPTLQVVGPPRSGTTLLSQVLANHLEVGCINNLIAAFWQAPVHGIRLARKLLPQRELPSYDSDYGRTNQIDQPHEFGYFWSSMLGYPDMDQRDGDEQAATDWDRLRTALINMTHAWRRPIVFKAFLMVWHIEALQQVLPRTCYVRIRRDPVENVMSLLRTRKEYLGSLDKWVSLRPSACRGMEADPPWMQVAAQVYHVERSMDEQIARMGGRQVIEVSYDALCRDPAGVVGAARQLLSSAGPEVGQVGTPPARFTPGSGGDDAELRARVREAVAHYFGDRGVNSAA